MKVAPDYIYYDTTMYILTEWNIVNVLATTFTHILLELITVLSKQISRLQTQIQCNDWMPIRTKHLSIETGKEMEPDKKPMQSNAKHIYLSECLDAFSKHQKHDCPSQ